MITCEQMRKTALGKLMTIGTARRGQLSQQYYQKADSNGKIHRRGPYYVWQRWVHGRKQSFRVPPSALARVRADLQRGREVHEIFEELWTAMEGSAIEQDADSKKKSRQSRRLLDGKSHSF